MVFDMTPGNPENRSVIDLINEQCPNIIILGFGMPLQERWLIKNWASINSNIAITAGAAFDLCLERSMHHLG
jgi:N-acetylglucosaminyldiphosphoundecaprenol N-acetyl-beta-D-mannosaminyltransferase